MVGSVTIDPENGDLYTGKNLSQCFVNKKVLNNEVKSLSKDAMGIPYEDASFSFFVARVKPIPVHVFFSGNFASFSFSLARSRHTFFAYSLSLALSLSLSLCVCVCVCCT